MARGNISPSESNSSRGSTAIELITEDVELGTRRPREYSSASEGEFKQKESQDEMAYEVEVLESSTGWTGGRTPTRSSLSNSTGPEHVTTPSDLTQFEQNLLAKLDSILPRVRSKSRFLDRALAYLSGPSPPITETRISPFPFVPFITRIERFLDRLFSPIAIRRAVITPLFLFAWFLAFTFLVRASFFTSTTSAGSSPQFLVGDDSFWSQNAGCGINGTSCAPFSNSSLLFRCPSNTLSVMLLNQRAVGATEVNFVPLVVGGFDELATYRADSWICAAAIQQGLFGNSQGGCGQLEMTETFQGFVGGSAHGVSSVGFDSVFPSTYRFTKNVSQQNCKDLSNDILGFNVAMSTVFSLIIRPSGAVFFWTLFLMGYWHVVMISDPTSSPPNVSLGFEYLLPALFAAYAFWRFSWRYVVPAFDSAIMERTIWYLGGYWVGVLINTSLAWIPITVLTPQAIKARPGALVAVIAVSIFLFFVILNQLRVIRRTGWLFFYLKWYAVGGIIIGCLCALPGLQFRLHHYTAAMLLMPGCAFVTRPSALFQGFLLGVFLDGIGRWGFDTILATPASLIGDGAVGGALPAFLTSATNFTIGQAEIWWQDVPSSLVSQWNGFVLLVDDVEVYSGSATSYPIASLASDIPHYFRLAYQQSGTLGDFTMAATAFFSNGSWINPAPGPS